MIKKSQFGVFWPAAVAFFVPLRSKMEAERGSAAKTSPVRAPAILLHCSCNDLQSQEHFIHNKRNICAFYTTDT